MDAERIVNYLKKTQRTLFIGLLAVLTCIFIQICLNEIKFDVKYLEKSLITLQKSIENTSLIDTKGFEIFHKQNDFKEHSSKEMKKLEHEIQTLNEYLANVKHKNGIKEEELSRFDLALDNAGGRIASVYNTRLLDKCSIFTIATGLCHRRCPPEKAIENSLNPNQCFCFRGNEGEFSIRLACEAEVDGVTIEHIDQSLTPTNDISSAPKEFSLTGLRNVLDEEGFNFGKFEFDPKLSSKKTFKIPNKTQEKFKLVKVSINQNHGDAEMTCIYRIQIHGFVEKC